MNAQNLDSVVVKERKILRFELRYESLMNKNYAKPVLKAMALADRCGCPVV